MSIFPTIFALTNETKVTTVGSSWPVILGIQNEKTFITLFCHHTNHWA